MGAGAEGRGAGVAVSGADVPAGDVEGRGATLGAAGGIGTGGDGGSAGLVTAGATVVGRLTAAGGAAAGFSASPCAAGGAIGRGGGAAGGTASFFCVMAFKTSPGREMFDRSILVLISSSPREAREAALLPEAEPSAVERRYTRTFSASCSSRELECVFFSVTPIRGSVSRMALLLTSSSRARSLMRTLLIRPFVSPCSS